MKKTSTYARKMNYDKLDALILERINAISGGPLHFIFVHEVHDECNRIATETGHEAGRIIDRRLQALRKRGVIAFDSKIGWSVQ